MAVEDKPVGTVRFLFLFVKINELYSYQLEDPKSDIIAQQQMGKKKKFMQCVHTNTFSTDKIIQFY